MKEGTPKGPEDKRGYKIANWIEHKSFIVGTVALIASIIAPALLGVAAWEGVQIVGAEAYKDRVKKKDMKPGKEYAVAA